MIDQPYLPIDLAIDPVGDLYAQTDGETVWRSMSSGQFLRSVQTSGARGVALDPASDHLLVTQEGSITKYRSDGTPLAEFGVDRVTNLGGITVGAAGLTRRPGRIRRRDSRGHPVWSARPGHGSRALARPLDDLRATRATLRGSIDPEGVTVAFRFACAQGEGAWHSGDAGALSGNGSEQPVSTTITGLSPATTYEFRLLGSNHDAAVAATPTPVATFTTPPALAPEVSLEAVDPDHRPLRPPLGLRRPQRRPDERPLRILHRSGRVGLHPHDRGRRRQRAGRGRGRPRPPRPRYGDLHPPARRERVHRPRDRHLLAPHRSGAPDPAHLPRRRSEDDHRDPACHLFGQRSPNHLPIRVRTRRPIRRAAPASGSDPGESGGSAPTTASEQIGGLTPGTTYHFRVLVRVPKEPSPAPIAPSPPCPQPVPTACQKAASTKR